MPSSYVSLCDNEKTGCRARELKSVYVDTEGQFLKLVLHQNHANKYNIYNQVTPPVPTQLWLGPVSPVFAKRHFQSSVGWRLPREG